MSFRPSSLRIVGLLVTVLVPAGVACSSSSDAPLGAYNPGADSGGGGGGNDSGGGGGGNDSGGGGGNDSGGGGGNDSGGGNDTGAPPACTGLAFCEDFETLDGKITNGMTIGAWKASVSGTITTFAVDGVKPHSGSKALHITVSGNMEAGAPARGTLNQTKAGGLVTGNNLFGRAMVFYSDQGGNGLPLAVHSWLFNSSGMGKSADASTGNVTMNMGGGGAKMQLNYHPVAPATEQSMQGGTMTTGVWHCVQWQYDGAGTPPANTAKVWVDGAVAVDVPATKGWEFATPWTSMDFGFTHYQTLAAGVDVYLDDFAVNDTMVACP